MDQPIVSYAYIHAKGRDAAARGDSRDSHGMNWHAPALKTWHEGFDSVRPRQISPASHIAPHRRGRIDLAHSGAIHPQTQGA